MLTMHALNGGERHESRLLGVNDLPATGCESYEQHSPLRLRHVKFED